MKQKLEKHDEKHNIIYNICYKTKILFYFFHLYYSFNIFHIKNIIILVDMMKTWIKNL